jgi:hypothetical protein
MSGDDLRPAVIRAHVSREVVHGEAELRARAREAPQLAQILALLVLVMARLPASSRVSKPKPIDRPLRSRVETTTWPPSNRRTRATMP